MTEDEFLEYNSKLWSMLIWGNKKYVVDKMIADNGFGALKRQLAKLLYGMSPIDKRWDVFLKSIKGMGPATINELLTYVNLQEYVILIKRRYSAIRILKFRVCPSTITNILERNM